MRRERRGFALMAALWLVVIIGVTSYELSVRSRARRLAVANALETVQAAAATEAAIETAEAALAFRLAHPPITTPLDPWADLSSLTADTIHLGDERATARVFDAGARLQINRASEDDIRRLLVALPLDAGEANRIAQRIMDWRDADDFRRAEGAERDEYLKAGARMLPRNTDFMSVDEIKNVQGVTSDLYARVLPYLTVIGSGQINVNAAPRAVLRSLPGFTEETIDVLLSTRRSTQPLRSIEELSARISSGSRAAMMSAESELGGRVIFDARAIVAETEGWVAGSPVHVHGVAMFERSGDAINTTLRRVDR